MGFKKEHSFGIKGNESMITRLTGYLLGGPQIHYISVGKECLPSFSSCSFAQLEYSFSSILILYLVSNSTLVHKIQRYKELQTDLYKILRISTCIYT